MTAILMQMRSRVGAVAMAAAALAFAWPAAAATPAKSAKPAATAKAPAKAKPKATAVKAKKPAVAEKELAPRSEEAATLISWVEATHDNFGMPYIVIDKQSARLFLFDATGKPLGEAPVLLGIGVGDESTPGVGSMKLANIGPAERTTPAGRYLAKFGRAAGHEKVLWVDYPNSVALHAVITSNKKERRVARLQSPEPDDNRITFGCINVGTSFYAKKVQPVFAKKGGLVYILPDTKPLEAVFPLVRFMPTVETADAS